MVYMYVACAKVFEIVAKDRQVEEQKAKNNEKAALLSCLSYVLA